MRQPLFHHAYGDALTQLSPAIVRIHNTGNGQTWHGEATMSGSSTLFARLVRAVMGLPPATGTVAVQVTMQPDGDGETWRRVFADHHLTTQLRAGATPGTIEETLWPMTVVLRLVPDEDGVRQVLEGVRLFGLPAPRFLWPELDIREDGDGDVYRFRVIMRLGGMLLEAYEGWLETPEQA